jgi:Family of unknown function (DUF6600)/FecR protein
MRAIKIKWMAGIVTAALMLATLPLFAQTQAPVETQSPTEEQSPADAQAPAEAQTQTSSAVARVSLIKGDVSMQRGDSGEWVAVTVNTPLVPGDTIATGGGSRAEVQLDYSNVMRLDQNTEVKIADLNGSRIQLQVSHGTADLAVFQNNQANSEVDTPNVAVQALQPGTYRIDVNSDSLSLVTVRQGQAQISTPQGSTNLDAGQQITVEGTQNPQYRVANAPGLDNWDNWNRDRDSVIENAQNYNHVNQYYTGAQDLNTYGHWSYVPGYDWCWTPYVDAGWVPYSYGRWVWEPFYGWTWVSYDPWGWAPYHYGRWFYYGSSWCWWPGAVTPFYRPLWAPAYVSFFGFGYGYHHFSFGFGYGFGSIGWCPLGPRDPFHRWWGHDHSFRVDNYNNFYGRGGFDRGRRGFAGSNLALLASDRQVRRGLVTMPGDRFGRAAVRGSHQIVSEGMLRNADLVRGTLPVVPTRASLRTTNRAAIVPAVARSRGGTTHFFTRNAIAATNRGHSFDTQAASIRRMVETHNGRSNVVNRTGTNAGAGRNFGARNSQAENARGREQRLSGVQRGNSVRRSPAPVVHENPQRQNGSFSNARGSEANQSGWRRFGSEPTEAQARNSSGGRNSAPIFRQSPQGNRSNGNRFSGKAPSTSREAPNRGFERSGPRGEPTQGGNNGFRHFTPQPAQQSGGQNQRGFSNFSRSAPQSENNNRAGWSHFTPGAPASPQRGGGGLYNGGSRGQGYSQPRFQRQPNYGPGSYSRPPLRLNKPIVSEPRSQSYGGFHGGYAGSAPSYHESSGGGFHGSFSGSSHGGGGGFHSSSSGSHGGGGGRHGR